jgi:inorganic pyrophosphatase
VPQTKAEDGDPLDVLVLMDDAAFRPDRRDLTRRRPRH